MTNKTNGRVLMVMSVAVLAFFFMAVLTAVLPKGESEIKPTETSSETETVAEDLSETLSKARLERDFYEAPMETVEEVEEEVDEEVEEEVESLEEAETETEAPAVPSTTPAVAVTEPVQAEPVVIQETTAAPAPAHVHVEETKHEHQWSPEYALVTKSENVKVIDVEAHTEEKQVPLGTCSYACDTCGLKMDNHDEMINHLLDAHSGGSCTYVPNYETQLVQVEEQFHYETVSSEVEEHVSDTCLSCGERRNLK